MHAYVYGVHFISYMTYVNTFFFVFDEEVSKLQLQRAYFYQYYSWITLILIVIIILTIRKTEKTTIIIIMITTTIISKWFLRMNRDLNLSEKIRRLKSYAPLYDKWRCLKPLSSQVPKLGLFLILLFVSRFSEK